MYFSRFKPQLFNCNKLRTSHHIVPPGAFTSLMLKACCLQLCNLAPSCQEGCFPEPLQQVCWFLFGCWFGGVFSPLLFYCCCSCAVIPHGLHLRTPPVLLGCFSWEAIPSGKRITLPHFLLSSPFVFEDFSLHERKPYTTHNKVENSQRCLINITG